VLGPEGTRFVILMEGWSVGQAFYPFIRKITAVFYGVSRLDSFDGPFYPLLEGVFCDFYT